MNNFVKRWTLAVLAGTALSAVVVAGGCNDGQNVDLRESDEARERTGDGPSPGLEANPAEPQTEYTDIKPSPRTED